ncbi:MAG: peptidoglycan DD-metalloendopeptidase family protein [Salinivirgaceae bacterium]|nr:peptidoglycan DD-metalloendopeptidase family protein [Salinivirgaceae bacterium]
MKKKLLIAILAIVVIMLFAIGFLHWKQIKMDTEIVAQETTEIEQEPVFEPTYMYGIPVDSMMVIQGTIKRNETFAGILRKYNIANNTIASLIKMSDTIFDLRTIRAGNPYVLICSTDTTPLHFVYEQDKVNYILFTFGDSMKIAAEKKEIILVRKIASGIIESNLWNTMIDFGINPIMSIELSEIYAWSIDFFGLQKGDHFSVIYDEEYVDTIPVGIGKIYSAIFNHQNKEFYAIQFTQDNGTGYFDEKGESLQRAFLKAPLRFSRISSRFSHSRLHPVLKIRRPHHGVDYAAPAGTPVYSVGDGVIIAVKYTKQGGKTLKVKHNSVYTTGYLHLSNYAKGIKTGSHVKQGQLIGYVGSTGLATGPHLDFRFWKNGQAIDPLKVESPTVEPIKKINREEYEKIKNEMIENLIEADNLLHEKYPNRLKAHRTVQTDSTPIIIK